MKIPTDYSARQTLAENVRALMELSPDKNSAAKLARRCFWPAGKKKGKRISERQIRYVLDTRVDAEPPVPSPTLDVIIAIANAFEVPTWQLFADDRLMKLWNLGKLFTISEGVTDKEVEKYLPLPPTAGTKRSKGAGRG